MSNNFFSSSKLFKKAIMHPLYLTAVYVASKIKLSMHLHLFNVRNTFSVSNKLYSFFRDVLVPLVSLEILGCQAGRDQQAKMYVERQSLSVHLQL